MLIMETTLTRRALSTAALTVIGLVPTRMGLVANEQPTGAGDPIAAAVAQSNLEVTGNVYPLYQRMHSDSRGEVPLYAVEYWYDRSFLPLGPEVIQPTGVRKTAWTWEVTGVSYANTAEVSFTQSFADGSTAEDVVRLVEQDDEWRWFFGRTRAFVDEQIALAGADVFPDQTADAPTWASTVVASGIGSLDNLPVVYPGDREATVRTGSGDRGNSVRRYTTQEGYTVASVEYQALSPDQTAIGVIQRRLDDAAQVPDFEVLAWDLSDEAEIPFATFRTYAGEVNANVIYTVVASQETGNGWTVSAPTREEVDNLGATLAG